MQIDWFTFIAQILNFLLLVWLLKRFLYGPVIKAMDEREARIAEERHAAAQAQQTATELQTDYQHKLTALENAKAAAMAAAEREVGEWKHTELQQAKADVEGARSEWQKALDREQQGLVRELQLDVSQHATDIAKHLLQQLADQRLQSAIVAKFVKRLIAERTKLAQMLHTSEHPATLAVESSHELQPEDRQQISEAVQQLTHADTACTFHQNAALICGIELQSPGVKVAWSIQESLAELESDLIDTIAGRVAVNAGAGGAVVGDRGEAAENAAGEPDATAEGSR